MDHRYQRACNVVCLKVGPIEICTTRTSFHLLLPPANKVWDKVIFSEFTGRGQYLLMSLAVWLPGLMFLLGGVSVLGSMFLLGVSVWGRKVCPEVIVREISVRVGSLCPGEFLSRGFLSGGVSVWGGLCPGVSVLGSLCPWVFVGRPWTEIPRPPITWMTGQYASHWNAVLF